MRSVRHQVGLQWYRRRQVRKASPRQPDRNRGAGNVEPGMPANSSTAVAPSASIGGPYMREVADSNPAPPMAGIACNAAGSRVLSAEQVRLASTIGRWYRPGVPLGASSRRTCCLARRRLVVYVGPAGSVARIAWRALDRRAQGWPLLARVATKTSASLVAREAFAPDEQREPAHVARLLLLRPHARRLDASTVTSSRRP